MNTLTSFSSTPVVQAVGWTLLHFLWQGCLIAGILAVVLLLLRKRSADARYQSAAKGPSPSSSPPQKSHSGLHSAGGMCKAAFRVSYGRRGAGRYSSSRRLRLFRRTGRGGDR